MMRQTSLFLENTSCADLKTHSHSHHLKMNSTLTCEASSGQSWLLHLYCMYIVFIRTSRHLSVKTNIFNCLFDDKHICHDCTIQCLYLIPHLHKPGIMFYRLRDDAES